MLPSKRRGKPHFLANSDGSWCIGWLHPAWSASLYPGEKNTYLRFHASSYSWGDFASTGFTDDCLTSLCYQSMLKCSLSLHRAQDMLTTRAPRAMGELSIDLLYLHIPNKVHVSNVFSKPLPYHSLNLVMISAALEKTNIRSTKDEDCNCIYDAVSFSLE